MFHGVGDIGKTWSIRRRRTGYAVAWARGDRYPVGRMRMFRALRFPFTRWDDLMKRLLGAALVTMLISAPAGLARADDDASAILDKAIKAVGGAEQIEKAQGFLVKAKGTLSFNGSDNAFETQATVKDLDHYRGEFEGQFGDNKFKGVTVVSGDKGWRKFGDEAMEIDGSELANEKRRIYLQLASGLPGLLKGKGFKLATAGEDKVDGKPAVGLKVTGPDGKDFTIYYDKETGLPVKQVARVVGFQGEEFTQESTYSNFKDFGGVKRASKIVATRDGEKFLDEEVAEFKLLDKVDAAAFAEPQ
jgi:hypothetical protein